MIIIITRITEHQSIKCVRCTRECFSECILCRLFTLGIRSQVFGLWPASSAISSANTRSPSRVVGSRDGSPKNGGKTAAAAAEVIDGATATVHTNYRGAALNTQRFRHENRPRGFVVFLIVFFFCLPGKYQKSINTFSPPNRTSRSRAFLFRVEQRR